MGEETGPTERGRLPADLGRYAGHGLTWALSTALFLYLGLKVDEWLGTLPLFTVLGAVIGAGAGFYSLYYHLVIEPRDRAEEDGSDDG